ncbi:MAG: TonB-dependent receptor plug domain-containing protein [Xanthomonadales bacterium]|nr:TonB-dependent receptor plug domain-containing protein [Xanthomonadales bacterium]
MNPRSAWIAGSLLVLSVAALAAQGEAGSGGERRGEAEERAVGLGLVEVTARRRMAATALTEADFETRQIRRLDDLKAQVPNIVIEPNTGTTTGAKIFLRGVGADKSLFTNDPAVAIDRDDVDIPRQTGALFALFDIERIEVLRGPQGTLDGRNATGGAIRFITRRPGGPETRAADGLVGNAGGGDLCRSWSRDLAENWFLQGALLTRNRDGYMRDLSFDRKVNDEEVHAARLSVLGRLDERTTVTITADVARARAAASTASGPHSIRSPPPTRRRCSPTRRARRA